MKTHKHSAITTIDLIKPSATATHPIYHNFISLVNQDRKELNIFITQYNRLCSIPNIDNNQIIKKLEQIYQRKQQIEDHYPPRLFSECPDYQVKIQKNLFNELKLAFNNCGITTLREDKLFNKNVQPSYPIADIIANMAPEKVDEFLSIINSFKMHDSMIIFKQQISNLYYINEPGYIGFQNFLRTHSIEYLGGGNSVNFKISSQKGDVCVLKASYLVERPNEIMKQLDPLLGDTSAETYASRQGNLEVAPNHFVTQNLVVNEFCSGGNLEQCAKKIDEAPNLSSSDKIRCKQEFVVNIFSQLADTLLKLDDKNIIHTDMKNSNFTTDKHLRLKIADDKGFCITKDGVYDRAYAQSQGYLSFVNTTYINPPEFYQGTFSASDAHSFMLGKNIYHILTGCDIDDLTDNSAQNFDFSHPIFTNREGIELKKLIEELIKPDPNDRMSMTFALFDLLKISKMNPATSMTNAFALSNKAECVDLLATMLTTLTFKEDHEMVDFIQDCLDNIHITTDEAKLDKIKNFLNDIVDDPVIQTLITKYAHSDPRLLDIIAQIPVEARGDVIFETPEWGNLEKFIEGMESSSRAALADPLVELWCAQKLDEKLYPLSIKAQCLKHLSNLSTLTFSENDKEMSSFIDTQLVMIADTKNNKLAEVANTLQSIANDPVTNAIHAKINEYRINKTYNGPAKANNIAEAMSKVPVDCRGSVLNDQVEDIFLNVQKALATHRITGHLFLNKNNSVNEDKAVKSFRTLKELFREERKNEQAPDVTSTPVIR